MYCNKNVPQYRCVGVFLFFFYVVVVHTIIGSPLDNSISVRACVLTRDRAWLLFIIQITVKYVGIIKPTLDGKGLCVCVWYLQWTATLKARVYRGFEWRMGGLGFKVFYFVKRHAGDLKVMSTYRSKWSSTFSFPMLLIEICKNTFINMYVVLKALKLSVSNV